MNLLEVLGLLKGRDKKKLHELKWKLPEGRFIAQVQDSSRVIPVLKKLGLHFVGGGEFVDSVFFKEFGEGIYAYYIVRTDKRNEKETLLFEGYMLEEEEKLGVELESSFLMINNLKKMGYKEAFIRDLSEWVFYFGQLKVVVYSIAGVGDFVEVCIPKTKFVKARENMEKHAFHLFEKLGIKKEEVMPADMLTLQLMTVTERK